MCAKVYSNKSIPDDIRGAIFDLDGTLLDSMGMWQQIDVDFLAKRGIPLPPDYQAAITPLGAKDAALYTIRRFGFDETPEELIEEWTEMAFCHYRDDIPLKPFALSYVKQLYEAGVSMAIATSSERGMVEAACKRTGLSEYIPHIVTVADVGIGKEFPDIYLTCAGKMGTAPSECAVYEDIIEGIRTAQKAGFFTVGVYEQDYHHLNLVEQESDLFIRSFEALINTTRKGL